MTFPTPPAPRIAYDESGAIGFFSNHNDGSGMREVSQDFLRMLNSDGPNLAVIENINWSAWPNPANATEIVSDGILAVRLPVAHQIKGIASAMAVASISGEYGIRRLISYFIEASIDSTNGVDGTWVQLYNQNGSEDFSWGSNYLLSNLLPNELGPFVASTMEPGSVTSPMNFWSWNVWPERRKSQFSDGLGWHEISAGAGQSFQWVRFRTYGYGPVIGTTSWATWARARIISKLHLYGIRDTPVGVNLLDFVDTSGAKKDFFDFGDIHENQTLTQNFKIKNPSAEAANGIQVSILPENPSTTTPAPDSWCQLSIDGGATWDSAVSIASLAPGASSATITLRVITQAGIYGPWSPRLKATVGSWS